MNSIILNVAIVYGTAYVTKEVISHSIYYTVYYSAVYVKNRAVEKIYSYFTKEPHQIDDGIELIMVA
jgi:hypothetical protein